MATYNSFKRISSDSFVANTLTSSDFAPGSVINGDLAPGSVQQGNIALGAVGATQLASSIDLSTKTVTYRTIAAGDISASANISSGKLAAGAATNNLGYTPLNRAGGAVSGQLRLTSGSASTPAIASSSSTNTGIYFPNDNTVRIATGGTERARWDAAGRFMQGAAGSPQTTGTPMFQSHGTNGWLYNNQLGAGTGWQELGPGFGWTGYQRNGSGFNYTTGRYTIPVAGHYNFQWLGYQHNDTSWTSATGHMHMSLGKSGSVSAFGGRVPHGIWAHGNGSPYPHGVNWQISSYFNAGEYASVWCYWSSNNNRFHSSHSFFNGYLIG